MRKIVVASSAGFCFGVRRAVELAEGMLKQQDLPAYSFGPVVHNETVVRELEGKGLVTVHSTEELKELPRGRVLIRAHGVSEATEEEIRALGFEIVDATCPFVKKIHRIVRKASEEGGPVLIVGDPDHPEVQGILGWAKGPAFVIPDAESVEKIPFSVEKPLNLVVQTTFQPEKLKKIVEILTELGYNLSIADTVCSATRERQEEAEKLAEVSDVMLVIGSKTSSNSRKLYEICKKRCDHTYFIQTAADIQSEWLQQVKCVGITAGASTPKIMIEEVQNDVRV